MKKRLLLSALTFASVFALAGCSTNGSATSSTEVESTDTSDGTSNSDGSSEDDSSYNTTIKVWWLSGTENKTIMETAIEEFHKTYPNVTIQLVTKPGLDVYNAYLLALNDDKSRPDLAIVDHVYVQNLAFEDQIANLTEIANGEDFESSYPSSLQSANSYLGSSYAFPLSANTVVLMCNMDILNAAGITEAPTTLTELLADCEAIKTKTTYRPFAQPINSTFSAMEFSSYVAREKGSMVSDDYKTVTMDSTNVRKAIDDWTDLSKYASQSEYEEGQFSNGTVGFIEMGSWSLSGIAKSASNFTLKCAPMVTIDADTPNYSGLGLYSYVVAEKSTSKKAAYQFGKFLSTNKTFQNSFAKAKGLLPVSLETLNDTDADAYVNSSDYLKVYGKQLQTVSPRPGTPIWPTMEKQITNMLYKIVTAKNEDTISAAITYAQTKCQDATDRKFGA